AAPEAGYMSAPGDAPKSALKIPLAQGAVIHVAQIPSEVKRLQVEMKGRGRLPLGFWGRNKAQIMTRRI
ncbi:hypothetical protein, partial [Paracoccus siganidrum]|uniref:hypothetical protein n=1 Tax=Paracoccus siganidrum TaxID=1276757 RepID=UPI001C81ED32